MGISSDVNFSEFELGGQGASAPNVPLLLDSSYAGKCVDDITYAEAGTWVAEEICALDLADAEAIRARIEVAMERLSDLKACALWPISAHAHMQVVHQLEHLLIDIDVDAVPRDTPSDMAFSVAAKWADNEVLSVDLRDPHAIAARIHASAEKLEDKENCRQWPGSAYAHRKVVTDLTIFLKRTRGTLH